MRYEVNGEKTINTLQQAYCKSTKRGHGTAMRNELKLLANHVELLHPRHPHPTPHDENIKAMNNYPIPNKDSQ